MDMYEDVNELCRGCNEVNLECAYEEWNNKKFPCPCTVCLIKMVCKQSCKDFREYANYKDGGHDEQTLYGV